MIARPLPVPAPPERVLIVKPSALGDVVTAVPVLRGLRRTFPDARISWLLSDACAPILAHDADLDETIPFPRRQLGPWWRSPSAARLLREFLRTLRRGAFDWVIDLQGLFRSGLFARVTGARVRAGFADAREGAWAFYTHRVRPEERHTVDRNLALASSLGVDARREDMTLSPSPAAREFAEGLRGRIDPAGGGFLAFVPPTRWETKSYPPRRWRTVAAAFAGRMPVALLGTRSDRALCERVAKGAAGNVVNLAGETTIPQMVALIASAACVVCSDSAAQFIAQAVGVPVVTLMGPTRPERTGPILRGQAVVADVPCQGCLRRRCRHITCMQTLAPETVVSAIEKALNGHP